MIRVGQVGIGQWGKNHCRILNAMNNIDFVGVYDSDPQKMDNYENLPRLINDSDALIITTPTSTHYEIAKQALENDVHVFIEKPVCTEVWQAEDLSLLSTRAIVQIGHIERFNPAYQRLKKEKALPLFPVCKRFGRPNRDMEASVVMDLMIHDIDLIIDLAQSPIKKVEASSGLTSATLTFENGIMALLQASHVLEKERTMEIISEYGNEYKLDFIERTLHKNGEVLQKKTDDNLLGLELKAFIKSIEENKQPLVGIEDAIKSLRVAKKIEALIDLS